MNTLQTMRGRLSLFSLTTMSVLVLVLIDGKATEIQVLNNRPALQISKYFTPETRTPAGTGWIFCACIQGAARHA